MDKDTLDGGYYKTNGYEPVSLEAFAREELLQWGAQQNIDALVEGVMEHVHRIIGTHKNFQVRQTNEYTFPDGESFNLPYFVFSAHQIDVGVSRISYGLFQNFSKADAIPCCKIEIVQGRRYIDAQRMGIQGSIKRVMLEHIIRSFQSLVEKKWMLILSKRDENQEIARPYFEQFQGMGKYTQMTTNFGSDEWCSPLILKPEHRKVRRLFRNTSTSSG